MSNLLHIKASPRDRSHSTQIANAFTETYLATNPERTIDILDLFAEELPSFDGYALDAKYAIFRQGSPDPQQMDAWAEIEAVIARFKAADAYLFSIPMWNFGIPYRLKQFLDIVVQPGYTFTVSETGEYEGLLTGKKTVAIYARGGEYPAGSPAEAVDFQKRYMDTILGFMGLTDVTSILAEPTLAGGPDKAHDVVEKARVAATAAARAL